MVSASIIAMNCEVSRQLRNRQPPSRAITSSAFEVRNVRFIHLVRELSRIYLQELPFAPVGPPLRTGSASGTMGERRAQTRRNIVVRFDGNALILLQGVDGFEDGEALADGNYTQILQLVVVESSENIPSDGVIMDFGFVL